MENYPRITPITPSHFFVYRKQSNRIWQAFQIFLLHVKTCLLNNIQNFQQYFKQNKHLIEHNMMQDETENEICNEVLTYEQEVMVRNVLQVYWQTYMYYW